MVTLGLGLLFHETANKAHWLTGGADGLQGVRMWPLLGRFRSIAERMFGEAFPDVIAIDLGAGAAS